MKLKYVKANEFEKGKEDKWPKHKAKAVKDDKKDNNDDSRCEGHGNDNEQYDGEWEKEKSSRTKNIKAAESLSNNNTFILLADDHGPRKTITTTHDTTTTLDKATLIERTYTLSERKLNNEENKIAS